MSCSRRRWTTAASARKRPIGRCSSRSPWSGWRSRPRRRVSSIRSAKRSTSALRGSRPRLPMRWVVRHVRPSTAAAGAGRGAHRPDPRRSAAVAAEAKGPRGSASIHEPARSSHSSADGRTIGRSTIARSRRRGGRDRSSCRSSISRRSSRQRPKSAAT